MGSYNVDSPSGGGLKCVLSDPLDDYASYEEVFDGILEVMQNRFEGGRVDEVSHSSFILTAPSAMPDLPEESGATVDLVQVVRHDRAKGQVISVNSLGKELIGTSWLVVHQDPLRIEAWLEDGNQRKCGKSVATTVQQYVDRLVAAAEGGWLW